MKIKKRKVGAVPLLAVYLFAALISSCDHTINSIAREPVYPLLRVWISPSELGTVTALPSSGITGTQVTMVVNPKPGKRLKSGGLENDRTVSFNANPPYRFTLNNDIVFTPIFEDLPANQYSVSIGENIAGGVIAAYAQVVSRTGEQLLSPSGPAGREIVLKVYPEAGYVLKDGSLQYTQLDAQGNPSVSPVLIDNSMGFLLPAANVMVSGEFEKCSGAAEYIESGKQALLRNDYDSAVVAFDAAYAADQNNREAVFYSTLGRLATVAVNTDLQSLLRSIGFNRYPSNLNNIFTLGDAWANYGSSTAGWTKLPGWLQEYCGVTLPAIGQSPGGYYAFQNQQSIIQNTRIQGDYTMASYYILLFFNLMGSQINDLNDVVDNALRYGLGSEFEAAAARAEKLQYGETISIEGDIAEKLFIGDYLQDGEKIGRAELDLVFSGLRLFKSGLEWVSAYDLYFDRYIFRLWSSVNGGNFIPRWDGFYNTLNAPYTNIRLPSESTEGDCWDTNLITNTLVDFFISNVFDYYNELSAEPMSGRRPWNPAEIPGMLLLLNHFWEERSRAGSMMDKSKDDFVKAIDGFAAVYDYYYGNSPDIPQFIIDERSKYRWTGDALTELKNAVKSGGVFYFPRELSEASWNTASSTGYGINMKKLFTPGQINLDKLFVTQPGGKRPKFYGWGMDTTAVGQEIKEIGDIAGYEHIGFMLNLKPLKEIVVQGLEKDGRTLGDVEYVHTVFPGVLLNQENGRKMYTLYHELYNFAITGK
jgi:hypothetical protein